MIFFYNLLTRPFHPIILVGVIMLSNQFLTRSFAQFAKDEANTAILQDMAGTKADWGDYDNDGDLDLAVIGSNGEKYAKIYRNNNGTFEDIEADLLGISDNGYTMWGDFDGDDDLDLVITGETSVGVFPDMQDIMIAYIYRNDNGVFVNHEAGLTGLAGWAQWSDYDGDGDLDIAIAGRIGTDPEVNDILKIYNNDHGVFTEIVLPVQLSGQNTGVSIDWGDYDHDGDEDLFVSVTGEINEATNQAYSLILRNDEGVFSAEDLSIPGLYFGHVKWGDYDADDDLDLVVMGINLQNEIVTTVYQNNEGVFKDIGNDFDGNSADTRCFMGFLDWEDYDTDGDLDLLVSGLRGDDVFITKILRNEEGIFSDMEMPIPGTVGYAIWGDYDKDFDPDILIGGVQQIEGGYYNLTELYINEIRTPHTIQFEAVGEKIYGDTDFDLSATSSAGLAVNYEIISGPALLTDQTLSIGGAGEVVVRAFHPGNETHNPSQTELHIEVQKAILTASANDESMTYGDVVPVLDISYAGFVNGDDETSLLSIPEVSSVATSQSNVGTYDIMLSGGASDNYELVLEDGTLTIEEAILTATANNKTKTYGDVVPVLDISYAGFVNGDDETNLLSIPEASSVATSQSNVGTYDITLSGGTSSNYELMLVDGILTIEKATLTATANNKTMTYGDVVPVLDISYAGFVNGDDETSLLSIPEASSVATSQSNVGTYDITLSGGASSNYELVLVDGILTIEKVTLTATANNKTMTYGDVVPVLDISYIGFVNGDDETNFLSIPEASSVATSQSNVGTYDITLSGGASSNYELMLVDGILTIEKATLTATANDKSMVYGGTVPVLDISYTGFMNDDNENDLLSPPETSTLATSQSGAGIYPIQLTGGSAVNYTFMLADGALTIEKATLTATANNQTMTAGDVVPKLEITYAGFVNNDDITVLEEVPVANTNATSESDAGIYTITVTGGQSDNYELVLVDGELTIEEMVLAASPGSIEVRAYPNPTHDFIKIEVVSPSEIRLLNLQGQLITSESIEKQSLLNISELESGIYLLEVILPDQTFFRQRIIKTN